MSDLKGASQIPIGGMIIDAGNSAEYKTGSWAAQQPRIVEGKCTGCMMCVNYCPEDCIVLGQDDKVTDIDRSICKGCAVCVAVCPVQALEMD